jgi:Flp pilus assembly protein TadB
VITRRRRIAELAHVVEQLAVVIGAGCSLAVAMDRMVARGQGPVIDELTTVGAWMRDGQPAVRALRHWSMMTACDTTGRVAAAVASAPSGGDLAQRLSVLADVLHQRVHDERLAAMQRAARIAWTACGLAIVVALASTLP